MPFCTNCGKEVQADARFCPNCGTALAADGATSAEAPGGARQQQQSYSQPNQGSYQQGQSGQQSQNYQYQQNQTYQQRPVYQQAPAGYSAADIAQNKYLCILCYLGLLLLIPLLTKPDSPYCKYHSNQGLVLMLFLIAVSIVAIIPILGWIVMIVGWIFGLVCWIIGLVNVCSGHVKPLPLIGKITILS